MTTFTSVGDVAARNAERFGEHTAFEDDFRTISFAALHARALALRAALSAAGIQKGERVALLSRNRIECLEVFLSSDLGVLVVPINWRLGVEEIAFILKDCNPAILIIEPEFRSVIDQAQLGLTTIQRRIIFSDDGQGVWEPYEDVIRHGVRSSISSDTVNLSDPACIVYTSGTTGRPKGALLSHSGLLSSSNSIAEEMLDLGPQDVSLAVMPFFHVGGMWFHCFPSFASGAKTIIQAAFHPDDVLDAITAHGVTNVHLAPTMVGDLLDRPGTEAASASLKRIYYAASPMPVATLKRAMAQFPQSDFFQSYGSTESGPATWLGPAEHKEALDGNQERLNSCGRPFAGVEVQLVDSGEGVPKPSKIGELAVRSNCTMEGYWENPEATVETLEDGWVATGDLGRCDSDGFFFIVDRKNDMIITGGENVYPSEVEDVLCGLPGIAEAAVIGVPDDRWVERVVACVVAGDDVELVADRLIRDCKQRLSGYKCPKEILFVHSLPKNAAGKVLRRRLIDNYQFETGVS